MADMIVTNWWHGPGHFPDLAKFKCPLHVAMPCIGIDGCGTALQHMDVRFKANNVFDLEHRYRDYLEKHLRGTPLHLGKSAGDVNQVHMEQVEWPVDLLVAGCPCRHGRVKESVWASLTRGLKLSSAWRAS